MSFAILDEFARYTDLCILMRDIQFAVQLFWSKDGRDGRVGRQPTALSNQDSQTFHSLPAPAIPVDPALSRPRSSHFHDRPQSGVSATRPVDGCTLNTIPSWTCSHASAASLLRGGAEGMSGIKSPQWMYRPNAVSVSPGDGFRSRLEGRHGCAPARSADVRWHGAIKPAR